MDLFNTVFGKKTKTSKSTKSTKTSKPTKNTKTSKSSKKSHKPPQEILDKCKKYHIKTTTTVGDKRVYRPELLLRKLINRRKKELLKNKNKK